MRNDLAGGYEKSDQIQNFPQQIQKRAHSENRYGTVEIVGRIFVGRIVEWRFVLKDFTVTRNTPRN